MRVGCTVFAFEPRSMTPTLALLIALLLVLVLTWASSSLDRGLHPEQAPGRQVAGRFFFVALRLVIGWHFLVEGIDKITAGNWSSEAYLREATGPLAPTFRNMAGDRLVARLTL